MTTLPTSELKSTTGSSPLPSAAASSTAAITDLAKTHLTVAPSASAAPLVGANAPKYNLSKNFQDAYQFLAAGKKEEAKVLFEEILNNLKRIKLPADSLFSVACKIGLASSDAARSHLLALEAKNELDTVYTNRNLWDTHNTEKKTKTYHTLRTHLRQLQGLIPWTEVAIHEDLKQKLEECAKHIPLVFEFQERVRLADSLRKSGNKDALKVYKDALKLIEEKPGIEYMSLRALCLLKTARCYSHESEDGKTLSLQAKEAIFKLYAMKETLYSPGRSRKEDVFKLLSSLLKELSSLFPETEKEIHREIVEKLQVCQEALKPATAPSDAIPISNPSPAPVDTAPVGDLPESSPRKVTKGPVGRSWNFRRIFVALALTAIAVASAVAIYRRYIVRVN